MMIVTKKAMADDIAFVVNTLKHQDVTIPSFLSCAAPGLAVMLGMICMPLWNLFSEHPISEFDPMARLDSLISIIMFAGLGFFIFILVSSVRGKYLSLPVDVREHSLILQLIKRKVIFYSSFWLGINILAVVVNMQFDISDMFSWAIHFVSMLILWFVATVDMGRYDLAVFSSVIKAWRDGDKLDPEQLKGLDI